MGEGRELEEKEGGFGARDLVRDVADVRMKRIRARLAGRISADPSALLRHIACKDRREDKNR